MIDKLFTRKEIDRKVLYQFEVAAGLRYGIVFGLILVLVGWGVDAWESANTSLEFFWAKLPLATFTAVPLCALAGSLSARFHRSFAKILISGISGGITGLVAIHIPFEGVSTIAALADPAVRGATIFPFGQAAGERVVGMMAFGAVAGISAAWVQKLANVWAWDRSSSNNRMTIGAWSVLLVCAPIAITLGAIYDGGANASLRGPSRLTQRLIEFALVTPPNFDLNRASTPQVLDYGRVAPWRDKFSPHYTQRIADYDSRLLDQVYMDTEFDNGFIWRCQITHDGSNVRRCIDLAETYRDWVGQFLRTSLIRCEECFLRVEPEVIAWQGQNANALGNWNAIDIIHHSGGIVTARVAFEKHVVECRIEGATPVNLRECSYVK